MSDTSSNISYSISENNLIVSVLSQMVDDGIQELQLNVCDLVYQNGLKGVLLDLSGLNILDSFGLRMMMDLSKMVKLLGAKTVFVGLKAEIVASVIDLGYTDLNLEMASDYEQGILKLRNYSKPTIA